jgi:hypothetical protein
MEFLKSRAVHVRHIAHGWWAVIYFAWTILCSVDVFMEHYASNAVKAAYDQAWVAPKWGWNVSVVGFFAITVILMVEGSYRYTLGIERARDEELADSKANLKETQTRLYEGHPILVLELARTAGALAMGPSSYTLYLRNCGNRPARWVNVAITSSSNGNYYLSFGRIAVVEPKATERLLYTVHKKGESTASASLESFLGDASEEAYVTWYDLKIAFRDTDESERTETARLAYWPEVQVLASAEVPYTKKEFKQQ